MKGIVFTEFLELVETKFGIKTVEEIIETCDLKTKGVYTSIGTYDHKEMFQLVGKLSEIKSIPVPELLKIYGRFFFKTLSKSYPKFMEKKDLFTFLSSIDGYIHPEVLKLYPDAEFPTFDSEIKNENEMILIYKSSRKMADLAIGLIQGAATYYNTKVNIEITSFENEGEKVILKLNHIGSEGRTKIL